MMITSTASWIIVTSGWSMLFLQKLWVTSEPVALLDKKKRAFMTGTERTQGEIQGKAGGAAAAKQHVMFWTSRDFNRVWTAGGEQHWANQLDLFFHRFDSNHIPICHLSSSLFIQLQCSRQHHHPPVIMTIIISTSTQPVTSPLHTSLFPNSHPCCPLQNLGH